MFDFFGEFDESYEDEFLLDGEDAGVYKPAVPISGQAREDALARESDCVNGDCGCGCESLR